MDNPTSIDEETIGMVYQDDNYNDYNTRNTSKIDETLFMEPDTAEATSILLLRKKENEISSPHCTDT